MPNKIYKVLVTYTSGGNVYISAKDEAEAVQRALRAVSDGSGEIEPDTTCESDYQAEDCHEVTFEELDKLQRSSLAVNDSVINENK